MASWVSQEVFSNMLSTHDLNPKPARQDNGKQLQVVFTIILCLYGDHHFEAERNQRGGRGLNWQHDMRD